MKLHPLEIEEILRRHGSRCTQRRLRMSEWTEERTAELKRLWMKGRSASQISRALGGVTRCAVIGKLHRLGLVRNPSAPVTPCDDLLVRK